VKIEYRVLIGRSVEPDVRVVDMITWDDLAEPTYTTGRARGLVDAWVEIYGAERARELLAAGWSNGYTSTTAV
jgi:hypothetical protein